MYEHKFGVLYLEEPSHVEDFMVGRCFTGADDDSSAIGWVINKGIMHCMSCMTLFTTISTKHHCRACGNLICHTCGNYFAHIQPIGIRSRICKCCYLNGEIQKHRSFADTWMGRWLIFIGLYQEWELSVSVTQVDMKYWKQFDVIPVVEGGDLTPCSVATEETKQQTEEEQLNYLIECSRKYSGASSIASGNNSKNGSFTNPHSLPGSLDGGTLRGSFQKKSIFRRLILKFYLKIVNYSNSMLIVVATDDPNAQNLSSLAVGADVTSANLSVNFSEKKSKYQIQTCWNANSLKIMLSSKYGYVTILLKTCPPDTTSTVYQIIMLDKKVSRGELLFITEDMTKCWIGTMTEEEYINKYL